MIRTVDAGTPDRAPLPEQREPEWPQRRLRSQGHRPRALSRRAVRDLRVLDPPWFAESTAEWAAGRASPSDPHYLHTHAFLATPSLVSLGHRSESFVWRSPLLGCPGDDRRSGLSRRRRSTNVRARILTRLWKRKSNRSGQAMPVVLSRFAEWNAFTGSRDDGEHYRDGSALTDVRMQAEHTSFRWSTRSSTRQSRSKRGQQLHPIPGPREARGLRIEMQGAAERFERANRVDPGDGFPRADPSRRSGPRCERLRLRDDSGLGRSRRSHVDRDERIHRCGSQRSRVHLLRDSDGWTVPDDRARFGDAARRLSEPGSRTPPRFSSR